MHSFGVVCNYAEKIHSACSIENLINKNSLFTFHFSLFTLHFSLFILHFSFLIELSLILETVRLVLRHFTIADAPFMLKLVNDPSWIRYIGDRNVHTLNDAERYLMDGSIKSYADHGFGFYAVMLKGSETLVGTCGFAKRPFLERPDFGFAFLPEYTGKGYAVEMAVAVLAYAEEVLKLEQVDAITTMDNMRSINLLLKTGFLYQQIILVDNESLLRFSAELSFVHKDEEE